MKNDGEIWGIIVCVAHKVMYVCCGLIIAFVSLFVGGREVRVLAQYMEEGEDEMKCV